MRRAAARTRVTHGGVADERQRDEVGQQPLVQVGGQEHHERRGVDAQHDEVERVAPAADQGAEGRRRRPGRPRACASPRPTHEAVVVGWPACREPVGGQAEEGAQEAGHDDLWRGHRSRRRRARATTSAPAGLPCSQACPHRCLRAPARTYYRGPAACPTRFARPAAGGVAWPATEAVNVGRPPCPGRCVTAAQWELVLDRA